MILIRNYVLIKKLKKIMKVFNPYSEKIGGYSENDGTIDFYSRINCLINQVFCFRFWGRERYMV